MERKPPFSPKTLLRWLLKFIGNVDLYVSGFSLVSVVVITLAGVVMRKVVNRPLAWLEEMQLLFFVYSIFFGGAVAFRYGSQVSIDLVAERLHGNGRKLLEVFDVVITLVILAYFGIGAYKLMTSPAVLRKVTPYFKIGYKYIDAAVPISFVMMAVQYVTFAVRKFMGLNNPYMTAPAKEKGEGEA